MIKEGQECPKTGILEDFMCPNGVYDIVSTYMIPFWNLWDKRNTQKWFSLFFYHHQDDQEPQECPKTWVLEDFGIFLIFVDILDLPDHPDGDKNPEKPFLCTSLVPRIPKRYHMSVSRNMTLKYCGGPWGPPGGLLCQKKEEV